MHTFFCTFKKITQQLFPKCNTISQCSFKNACQLKTRLCSRFIFPMTAFIRRITIIAPSKQIEFKSGFLLQIGKAKKAVRMNKDEARDVKKWIETKWSTNEPNRHPLFPGSAPRARWTPPGGNSRTSRTGSTAARRGTPQPPSEGKRIAPSREWPVGACEQGFNKFGEVPPSS